MKKNTKVKGKQNKKNVPKKLLAKKKVSVPAKKANVLKKIKKSSIASKSTKKPVRVIKGKVIKPAIKIKPKSKAVVKKIIVAKKPIKSKVVTKAKVVKKVKTAVAPKSKQKVVVSKIKPIKIGKVIKEIKKEVKPAIVVSVEPVVKPRAKKVAFFSSTLGTEKNEYSSIKKSPDIKMELTIDEDLVVQPLPATAFMGVPPYEIKPGELYMNEEQKAHFEHMLQVWKKNLLKEADKTVNHMKDEVANLPDLNDRASIEEEVNFELRARDRDRKIIKKIDEALHRIYSNEFGYCELCGVEIGIRRLEARPTATLCIDCKTLAEIKEKHTTG
jgi:DnaK suppressor protein